MAKNESELNKDTDNSYNKLNEIIIEKEILNEINNSNNNKTNQTYDNNILNINNEVNSNKQNMSKCINNYRFFKITDCIDNLEDNYNYILSKSPANIKDSLKYNKHLKDYINGLSPIFIGFNFTYNSINNIPNYYYDGFFVFVYEYSYRKISIKLNLAIVNFDLLEYNINLFSNILNKLFSNLSLLESDIYILYDEISIDLFYLKDSNCLKYSIYNELKEVLKNNYFKWASIHNSSDGERYVCMIHKNKNNLLNNNQKYNKSINNIPNLLNLKHEFSFSLSKKPENYNNQYEVQQKSKQNNLNLFPIIYILKDLSKYNINIKNDEEYATTNIETLKNLTLGFITNLEYTDDNNINNNCEQSSTTNNELYKKQCGIFNIDTSFDNMLSSYLVINNEHILYNRLLVRNVI